MAIWLIRYKDRFGARRSVFCDQLDRPSTEQAFDVIQKSFSASAEGNLQSSQTSGPTLFGMELLSIEEAPAGTFD